MRLSSLLRNRESSDPSRRDRARRSSARPGGFRPRLEALEGRVVLSFGSPIATSVYSQHLLSQAVGDFNGDGKPDLVVATTSGIAVMMGKGNGHFGSPASSYIPGWDTTALAVADVNGDGKPDIIAGNVSTPDVSLSGPPPTSLTVLLNNGSGGFPSSLPSTIQTYQEFDLTSGPTSLAVADFDGDGRIDVAAVDADGHLDVVRNTGNGTFFEGPQSYTVGLYPWGLATVAAGDFNGDGKPDLAVGSGNLTVLLNNGLGGFAAPQSYADGGNAIVALAVGDVNGDGKLDLVTAFGTGNGIGVFSGNGDGTFGATDRTYAVGGAANFIALGDFNKDGKLDVVTTGSEMDVLLNNGDGTFGLAQKVGPAGSGVLVADFNGDGFPDLAQIDATGTSIDVLLNKADWQASGHKGHK